MTVLFSDHISVPKEVQIDLQKIITAIDLHCLEHGTDDNLVFDPKNNKLEQLVSQVRMEQSQVLDDLIQFNQKYNKFQMAFAESNKSNAATREQLEDLSKVVMYLDKTYREKVQRDQDLLKDDQTEALNFEQLNIKVT